MPVMMPMINRMGPQLLQLQARQARADIDTQHVFWQIDEISLSWPGVLETIPGLNALSIHFDSPCALEAAQKLLPALWKACLKRARARTVSTVTLGVCYGGRAAPYLHQVARHAGLSVDEWIDLHVRSPYTVVNLGTHPGLACLGELVPELQRASCATPRQPVSAGGIAVNQFRTAIAASTLPVGWSLVGVISKAQFNGVTGGFPSLQPGDRVCFERVDVQLALPGKS
jgi:KipI family sensor histidine kinase inhibitor